MPQPLLFYSAQFLEHQTAGHPESPDRLRHILNTLDQADLFSRLPRKEPDPIDLALLYRLHDPEYVHMLERFSREAGEVGQRIDEDTVVSTGTYPAALKAAGAAVDMTRAILDGPYTTAFSLVRPPGHHAMPTHTMGFCMFNNVALAALYALEVMRLKRVLILDWDAHHGNATEHMFYQDPRVLFVSWHQHLNWPGTGAVTDMGVGAGYGYNVNIPLPRGSDNGDYLTSFETLVTPLAARFQPELILVSAGYDAHHADLLSHMGLNATGFSLLTEQVMKLADRHCSGRAGFILEGGYHTHALALSVLGSFQTLMQEQAVPVKEPFMSPTPVVTHETLHELLAQISQLQPLLRSHL